MFPLRFVRETKRHRNEMWSPEQQTTQLAYKAGFDPTPKVEPFFAGMHTVSRRRPHPWLLRVACRVALQIAPAARGM